MQIRNYGINSKITQVAYDPVQSLIAVGTAESPFGNGQIYIFGQKRVEVVLPLPHRASVKILQFCAEKLLCVDSKNDLSVFSIETKTLINAHSPPANGRSSRPCNARSPRNWGTRIGRISHPPRRGRTL